MASTAVVCAQCGSSFQKENREINRGARLGRAHFCTLACAAIARNAPKRRKPVTRNCEHCSATFTRASKKISRFCTRSCAILGTKTAEREAGRRKAGLTTTNLLPSCEVLRRREGPRYTALVCALGERPHAFEYPLAGFVFDLVLFDRNTIVEFDGPYHRSPRQRRLDERKDRVAKTNGFQIVRIDLQRGEPIPIEPVIQL